MDCQAGLISAMPLPTTKQRANNRVGVVKLNQPSAPSAVAPHNSIESATTATIRRSCMSAMAPAGIEITITGSNNAVCTKATWFAEDVISVIAQAAPTPWIKRPRLAKRLASQMRRKVRWCRGAVRPSALNAFSFEKSVILAPPSGPAA